MSTTAEKLWNYIDGTCTPAEQDTIARLIEQDKAVAAQYRELLLLNSEFSAIETDEPPMAFTYNVMEGIRREQAAIPLKSAINKGIIRGIGLFFVFTITAMLLFALSQIKFSPGSALPIHFSLPNISAYFKGPVMQVFLFFDVVLALYLGDTYLRRKRLTKTDIGVQAGGQQNKS